MVCDGVCVMVCDGVCVMVCDGVCVMVCAFEHMLIVRLSGAAHQQQLYRRTQSDFARI
jgi:hypothetical protein